MKFKIFIAITAIILTLTSCTKDDQTPLETTSEGTLKIEFDNVFAGANLILNTPINTTSQGEILSISNIKYIVSNIILTKDDGTTFVYPKERGYFIVSEAKTNSHIITLTKIPAGNYTKIKIGIGVDEERYREGQTVQGDFFAQAQIEDMAWTWSAGYKHLLFEGSYTTSAATTQSIFMVHTGRSGSNYNYTDISLNFPDKALVRTNITPDVHILADVAKIIDGTNKIKLTDNNPNGTGAMIMAGAILPVVTANLSNMFIVDHVHND